MNYQDELQQRTCAMWYVFGINDTSGSKWNATKFAEYWISLQNEKPYTISVQQAFIDWSDEV